MAGVNPVEHALGPCNSCGPGSEKRTRFLDAFGVHGTSPFFTCSVVVVAPCRVRCEIGDELLLELELELFFRFLPDLRSSDFCISESAVNRPLSVEQTD